METNETNETTAEEWGGCRGHVCPLTAYIRSHEERMRAMEGRFLLYEKRRQRLFGEITRALVEMMELPTETKPLRREEERLRDCLRQLMDEKDGKGRFVFKRKCHWQGVYRFVVDHELGVADGDYAGFERLARWIAPEPCRVPFSLHALKHIANTNFTRPFEKWTYDRAYFKKRKPYDEMVAVVERLTEIWTMDEEQ